MPRANTTRDEEAEQQLRILQSLAKEIDSEPEPDFDDDEYDQEGQIQYKPEPSESVKLTISISQKTQVTQYEPAEAFLSMTITADTTEAEMDAALANGKLGWKKLTTALVEKIGELEAGAALGRKNPRSSR